MLKVTQDLALRGNIHKVFGKILVSIPLKREHERITIYTIDVKSIEVNGKRLSFDHDLLKNKTGHWGRTKIKNVIPYTLLEASIYKALVRAFSEKAKKRKAVYPFTDCFSYKSFGGKSLLGKEIPVISLVLGGGAKWKGEALLKAFSKALITQVGY